MIRSGPICNTFRCVSAYKQITTRHLTSFTVQPMLNTIAVVLIILWLLGMVSSYTIGGFIHILLAIAIIILLLRVIRGERIA